MKNLLSALAFILLLIPQIQGQTLALNTQNSKHEFTPYSLSYFTHPARPGALAIVGGCSIGIGCGIATCGVFIVAFDYDAANEKVIQSEWEEGHRLEIIGCVTIVAGIGMLVAGATRDRSLHRNRWGIIAPAKNEIGLAYGF